MTELPKSYGRRWHVETFMSGLKRLTLSHLRARLQTALFTEAAIRILAYTIHR
jgi:transposase